MKTVTPNGDTPEIVIDARADLLVEGHDSNEVNASSDNEDQLAVTQNESRVVIVSRSDCTVRVPAWAQVFVERAGGDCSIRNIDNSVNIRNVGGDLSVVDAGDISIESVGGDCSLVGVKGELQVRAIGGDMNAQDARFTGASLNVGGDATLGMLAEAGDNASVNAGGDVKIILLGEPNASVVIMDSNGRRRKTFGDGSATISVRCGGDALVGAETGEASEAQDEKRGNAGFNSGEFESTMGEFERSMQEMQRNIEQMAQQFASRFASMGAGADMDWKIQKAQMKAEAAARKAEARVNRHASKMEEHARQQAERAARHAERAARRSGEFNYSFTNVPPKPAAPPMPPSPVQPFAAPQAKTATDEERLVILRMLQEKKITSEQADQLLAALGS
jgi:hypothetical protein